MNYNENTREGRHLTPKERIALQAEEIKQLQQENEQLKADCDRMLGEIQELTIKYNRFKERLQISPYGDDKIDELDEALENCKFQYEQLKQENKQLRSRVAQYRGAWEQIKGFIKGMGCYCNYEGEYASQCQPCFIVKQIDKALAEIDKAIGGKEDV